MTARVIATIFALISFAAALLVGTQAGNPLSTILSRALLIMLGCYVIGRLIGGVAQLTVQHHIESYQARFPIPDRLEASEDFAASEAADPPVISKTSSPASAG